MRDHFREDVRWKWWHRLTCCQALWSVAEEEVTALLGTLPEQQSFTAMPLLTPFSYGKTWQQPLDLDPTVSLRGKQTNYSSVGLYGSSCLCPSCPTRNQQRQQSASWLAFWQARRQLTFFKLSLPWYSNDAEMQLFKRLTLPSLHHMT